MKKLLACVLALNFCSVDAGLIQKLKNSTLVKKLDEKIKAKAKQVFTVAKGVIKNEVTKVYQEQKILLSGQYLVPQQISKNLQTMISDVNAIIQNNKENQQVVTEAWNLYVLLMNCYYNISRVIVNVDLINQQINQLGTYGVDTEALQTSSTTLKELVSSTQSTYTNTLNSMIAQVTDLRAQTTDEGKLKIVDALNSLLQGCTTDTLMILVNYAPIYSYISGLSDNTLFQSFSTLVSLVNSMQSANTVSSLINELKGVGINMLTNIKDNIVSGMQNANKDNVVSGVQNTNNIVSGVQNANKNNVVSEAQNANNIVSEEQNTNNIVSEEQNTNNIVSEVQNTN